MARFAGFWRLVRRLSDYWRRGMIGATYPCPGDPLLMCSDAGATWWPAVIAAVLVAAWIGYRFGRFGGSRRRGSRANGGE